MNDKKLLTIVIPAAIQFWDAVIIDERISPAFKIIANECKGKISKLNELVALLPDI